MFFIVQEIPIPRFNRRMEQRCKYNHLRTIICNKQVLFLLNLCNIYKCLFFDIYFLLLLSAYTQKSIGILSAVPISRRFRIGFLCSFEFKRTAILK